jgi:hypothetical protein
MFMQYRLQAIASNEYCVHSTDHEMILANNVSLAAEQGSAIENNIRHHSTCKYSPLKERNKQGCYNAYKLPYVCS